MTDRTITKTYVESHVKEVEETLYLCRNCEQAYPDDEIITLAVDVDTDDDWNAERQVCEHCAETVLGYHELTGTERVAESIQHISWTDVKAIFPPLGRIAIPLIVTGFVGYVGLSIINAVLSELDEPATLQALSESSKGIGHTVIGLVPVLVAVIFLIAIGSTVMPRRI